MLPEARQDNLVVREVGDELVVYDAERQRAHCLNRTSALVWRHCDGRTTVAALAAMLERELGLPANKELVGQALQGLEKAHLVRSRPLRAGSGGPISRRALLKKLGWAGGLAALWPVVESRPALAQKPLPSCVNFNIVTGRFFGEACGTDDAATKKAIADLEKNLKLVCEQGAAGITGCEERDCAPFHCINIGVNILEIHEPYHFHDDLCPGNGENATGVRNKKAECLCACVQ